jgi:hypothetical protein
LRSELKLLQAEWAKLTKERQAVLRRLQKAVERNDDAKLMAELPVLKGELEASRRALARIVIAGQRTDKLRAEWHDWERHSAYVDDAKHAVKQERQELIASELRMRGVRLSSVEQPRLEAEPMLVEIPAPEADAMQVEEALESPTPYEMQDEDREEPSGEVIEYWDALISSLPPDQSDERSLARLLGAFRQVHGAQKSVDRRRGMRRYRLGAFDAWS